MNVFIDDLSGALTQAALNAVFAKIPVSPLTFNPKTAALALEEIKASLGKVLPRVAHALRQNPMRAQSTFGDAVQYLAHAAFERIFQDRACYSSLYEKEHRLVTLIDMDAGKSLTDDLPNVFDDLRQAGIDPEQSLIIYRNAVGQWFEIHVQGNGDYRTELLAADNFSAARAEVIGKNRVEIQ